MASVLGRYNEYYYDRSRGIVTGGDIAGGGDRSVRGMKQPKVTRRKVTDYIPDSHNANMGSERGLAMIERGLNKVGAGRSIVVDAHDKIPAGNKTLEAAVLAGIEDVIEIETDGTALIVHKRTDWDLDDPTGAAREYAYLDNRASEVGLTWDANVIAADVEAGVDLSGVWTQKELDALTHAVAVPSVAETNVLDGLSYRVIVECTSEAEQTRLLKRFAGEGLKCQALIS